MTWTSFSNYKGTCILQTAALTANLFPQVCQWSFAYSLILSSKNEKSKMLLFPKLSLLVWNRLRSTWRTRPARGKKPSKEGDAWPWMHGPDRGIVETLSQLCKTRGGEKKGGKNGHQSIPSVSLPSTSGHYFVYSQQFRVRHFLPLLPSQPWVQVHGFLRFPVSWSLYPEVVSKSLCWEEKCQMGTAAVSCISCLLAC